MIKMVRTTRVPMLSMLARSYRRWEVIVAVKTEPTKVRATLTPRIRTT